LLFSGVDDDPIYPSAMSGSGTEPPIWDVLATVAIGGEPDMTRAAQFSRD
jgi:hypothetical protein